MSTVTQYMTQAPHGAVVALERFLTAELWPFSQGTTPNTKTRRHELDLDEYHGQRDCFIVIDRSPSMKDRDYPPSRLLAAKDAARAFAKSVLATSPQSSVAIIGYGGTAEQFCPLTPATDVATIEAAIDRMGFGHATNITAGLAIVKKSMRRSSPCTQVVVLSDGYHNTGPQPTRMADEIKKKAIIETIGIGGSPSYVDEILLRAIASKRRDGTPRYRWIGDRSQLVRHFQHLGTGITRA